MRRRHHRRSGPDGQAGTRRRRQQNDAALHEAGAGAPRREVVRRARRLTTLRDYRGAVKPSVPRRRPGGLNDVALHEAVRARWRGVEVVCRAHPVDDTARLDLGVDNTARLPRGAVRLGSAAAADGGTMLHCTGGAGARREVVRRAHPVDDTARLDLDVDDTARLPSGAVKPSVRRGGRVSGTMLHCTNLCGRTGVRRFAAHDRLTTLRA